MKRGGKKKVHFEENTIDVLLENFKLSHTWEYL